VTAQSNAIPGSSHNSEIRESQVAEPVHNSAPQPLYWSVRREVWENRSLYLAPLIVAALILFGFLISLIHLPQKMRSASTLDPMQQLELMQKPYDMAALLLMGTTFIVAIFYCLDSLHGERRDRSILFWKSLPVSDLNVVLSKISIPLLVLPLLTVAVTLATQWIMLLLNSAVLLASGLSAAKLWTQLPWLQMSLAMLYHLLAIHALWYAPIYAWLLLVSGWARRLTFLWAGLPVLAIAVVEKIAFNRTSFLELLGQRLAGGPSAGASAPGGGMMDPVTFLTVMNYLSSPGLWVGFAIAAIFLAAAVRLRRYQGPI
jgi:ABC-2 type transport system permease protein